MANEKKGKAGRPPGRIITKHESVDLHPKNGDGVYRKSWMLFKTRFGNEFQMITGLPAGLLRGEHRRKMEDAVKGEYPKLRKSAMRMFMEGMLTGDEGPLQTVPTGSRARLEAALEFLDVVETMVYIAGLERLAELDKLRAPKTAYNHRPLAGTGWKRKPQVRGGGSGADEGESEESVAEQAGEFQISDDLGGLVEGFGVGGVEEDDPDGDIARVEGLAAGELESERAI